MIDHEKLGELLLKAAGNRSLRQYAKDAGIAHSRLFEMKRPNGPKPSILILMKLTSEEADPQNDVNFIDFLDAAGYGEWDFTLRKEWKCHDRRRRRRRRKVHNNKDESTITEETLTKILIG